MTDPMAVRISMTGEQIRFDLSTMIEEWSGFLTSSCGYDKTEPVYISLVAALVHQHGLAFHQFVQDEGMRWDDITGEFLVPQHYYAQMVEHHGGFPYSREALDLVWADCFDAVNEEFDAIEERVHQEREHGIV